MADLFKYLVRYVEQILPQNLTNCSIKQPPIPLLRIVYPNSKDYRTKS